MRAWFGVFPREDWAYYCFAILLPTVALWITWRLAARYLPPDKRVAGIVLLTFVPFYNFHAIKFNANTRADAVLGVGDVVVPALVRNAPRRLGGARRYRRRRGHAGANIGRSRFLLGLALLR